MGEAKRDLLRHALATVAYRGGKALRGSPPGFEGFEAAPGARTPGRILAHMGDLFDWAGTMAKGQESWRDSEPLPWEREVERFFASLARFDALLGSDAPLAVSPERLLQGPLADALTHVGQIAMLRRLAQAPVRGENYSRAEIVAGRVGLEQPTPRREFE